MSGLNRFACIVLRLTYWIAGPERRDWVRAMAAETDAADRQGTRWALGCLHAAAKDRIGREKWFLAALVVSPVLALGVLVGLTMILATGARALGVPFLAVAPLMLLEPLPAAWLLGWMRPAYPPLVVGTLAFALHQAGPLVAMWGITGKLPPFWSPNMVYYNLPAYAGLLASWAVWVGAIWWGSAVRRTSPALPS